MANEWQYMNTVNGWDRVDSAVTAKAEEAPELVISLPALREKAQRVRFLFAQQASLTAAKQESTRELNQLIKEGNALVDFIKTGARARYGKESEKVIEFGVKPFRSRSRKAAAKPPVPETANPTASTPDSAK
jgi:hypothetical protein